MKKDSLNIFCSVSAGYSSVLMAIKLKEWYPDHNVLCVMANTSKERIESLEFMHKCDEYFKLNLVWVEAIINPERGIGTDFKVVKYENLKTNGEIFEEGIKKYGIPCKINKWCNRELKLVPLKKYVDSIFGSKNYSVCTGIRIDEIDRVKKDYETDNYFYPLVEKNIDTKYRNKFWSQQPIKLKIPAYKGNCDLCFEKSRRKLMTIISEDKFTAKWWMEMTLKYSHLPIQGKDSYNGYANTVGMSFYRSNESIDDIIQASRRPFKKATDEYIYENELFDFEDDCGSGCGIYFK